MRSVRRPVLAGIFVTFILFILSSALAENSKNTTTTAPARTVVPQRSTPAQPQLQQHNATQQNIQLPTNRGVINNTQPVGGFAGTTPQLAPSVPQTPRGALYDFVRPPSAVVAPNIPKVHNTGPAHTASPPPAPSIPAGATTPKATQLTPTTVQTPPTPRQPSLVSTTPSTSTISAKTSIQPSGVAAGVGPAPGAYAALPKSTFGLSSFNTATVSKLTTATNTVAGNPGSSAGFAGWTPGLEKNGVLPDGRGYCTDYAAGIYNKVSGKVMPVVRSDKFYEIAKERNLPTLPPTSDAVKVVPPGSIVVWSGTGAGHVAIVTANDPIKKTITISEVNWGPPRAGATKYEKDQEITANFNTVSQRTLSYDQVAQRTGPLSNGKNYEYNLEGFVVPISGFENK